MILVLTAIIVYAVYKGCDLLWVLIAASIIICVMNGLPVWDTMNSSFLSGANEFFQNLFFKLLMSIIFGEFFSYSGAAASLAGILSKALLKNGTEERKRTMAIAMMLLLGYGLCLIGMDTYACLFALIPVTMSIFQETNIPRRFVPALLLGGISVAAASPLAPLFGNIICSALFGITASAALIPGFVAAIVILVLSFLYLNRAVKKACAEGEAFTCGSYVMIDNSELNPVHPLIGILPLLALFISYSIIGIAIEYACLIGIALCCVLFYKNLCKSIANQGEAKNRYIGTLNKAAHQWAPLILMFGVSAGMASVIQLTPAYEMINNIFITLAEKLNPLVSVALCTTFSGFLSGAAANSVFFAAPIYGPVLDQLGLTGAMVHRIATFAIAILDTIPIAPCVVTALAACGVSQKEGYKPIFMTTVLNIAIGLVVLILIIALFPGLAAN